MKEGEKGRKKGRKEGRRREKKSRKNNSGALFFNDSSELLRDVSISVPFGNINFIDFRVWYELLDMPQHIPLALFDIIPPIKHD